MPLHKLLIFSYDLVLSQFNLQNLIATIMSQNLDKNEIIMVPSKFNFFFHMFGTCEQFYDS